MWNRLQKGVLGMVAFGMLGLPLVASAQVATVKNAMTVNKTKAPAVTPTTLTTPATGAKKHHQHKHYQQNLQQLLPKLEREEHTIARLLKQIKQQMHHKKN